MTRRVQGQRDAAVREVETSADQYAPVQDTEEYLNSKGGVPREARGSAGGRDQGRNTAHRRRMESVAEEERHGAEVGEEARRQERRRSG